MDQLDVLERADEWRPGGEVDEGAGGRLKQHSLAVRNSLKPNSNCFCIVKISPRLHIIIQLSIVGQPPDTKYFPSDRLFYWLRSN